MRLTLSEKHTNLGFGTFVIFLYALYGAFISSLYIQVGDKGGFRSADFVIFVIVFMLLGMSNLGRLLIMTTRKHSGKSLILLFIVYLLLKLSMGESEDRIISPIHIFSEMGTFFIAGFIAFSVLELRMSAISRFIEKQQNTKGTRRLAIFAAILFIGAIIYFLKQFLGSSLSDIFQIRSLSNDYYQDFGDFIIIAFCCLVALQISSFKRNKYPGRSYILFAVVILAQAILAFVCLQAVTSNKSVAVILPVSVLAIYYSKPKYWLIDRGRIKIKALFVIPILLFAALLLYRYVSALDISQLHIFDHGESSSILTNSSMRSRWSLITGYGMDQLLSSPVFGDISITNYMHSSLLSTQTHLGFIGSMLLWSFILMHLLPIYRQGGNECLKAIVLPILIVSIISSFFTWGPLWFLIGALYSYQPAQPVTLSHQSYNNPKSSVELRRQTG